MTERNTDSPLRSQRSKLNGGQKFGIGCGALSLAVPLILWISLFSATAPAGSGCAECALGWYAVFSGWLAVPALIVALLIFIISSAVGKSKSKIYSAESAGLREETGLGDDAKDETCD
jgi:hypothetical protein